MTPYGRVRESHVCAWVCECVCVFHERRLVCVPCVRLHAYSVARALLVMLCDAIIATVRSRTPFAVRAFAQQPDATQRNERVGVEVSLAGLVFVCTVDGTQNAHSMRVREPRQNNLYRRRCRRRRQQQGHRHQQRQRQQRRQQQQRRASDADDANDDNDDDSPMGMQPAHHSLLSRVRTVDVGATNTTTAGATKCHHTGWHYAYLICSCDCLMLHTRTASR